MLSRLPLLGALALLSCGTEGPARYEVPVTAPEGRFRSAYPTVELREVTLPLYAELEEVMVENAAGVLTSDTDVLWADNPVRTVTRRLVGALSVLTNATVAGSPWPFEDPAEARIEVRFDRLIAARDGVLRAEGQYFVAPRELGVAGRAQRFSASAPYQAGSVVSIAQAQAIVLDEIARQIARDGL